jgi:hypothetical protein
MGENSKISAVEYVVMDSAGLGQILSVGFSTEYGPCII